MKRKHLLIVSLSAVVIFLVLPISYRSVNVECGGPLGLMNGLGGCEYYDPNDLSCPTALLNDQKVCIGHKVTIPSGGYQMVVQTLVRKVHPPVEHSFFGEDTPIPIDVKPVSYAIDGAIAVVLAFALVYIFRRKL